MYERIDGNFKERSGSHIACWELNSHLLKALVILLSRMALKFGEVTWRILNFSLESLWKGHEDAYDVSCQRAFFNYLSYLTSHIWRTFHIIIHSQAYYGFSTTAHSPLPIWIVNKATLLPTYLAIQLSAKYLWNWLKFIFGFFDCVVKKWGPIIPSTITLEINFLHDLWT